MSASRYLSNDLRWRSGDDPAQVVLTPAAIVARVRAVLGEIDLDPATTPENPTGATRFYALPTDGLTEPWDADRIYVNAPYGSAREPWLYRAAFEAQSGKKIIALIPNATETRVVQACAASCVSIVLVDKRIPFEMPDGSTKVATHGSLILGWNLDLDPLGDLGLVVAPTARYGARDGTPVEIEPRDFGGQPCGCVRRGPVGMLYATPGPFTIVRCLDLGRLPNAYEVNEMLEALHARYPGLVIDTRQTTEAA